MKTVQKINIDFYSKTPPCVNNKKTLKGSSPRLDVRRKDLIYIPIKPI